MKENYHVGLILDGNRRYAKSLGMKPWDGHLKGAEKIEKLFDWCKDLGVKEATLYCWSMQNFQRSKEEVAFIFALFKKFFDKLLKNIETTKKNDIRIKFLGRIHLFPKDIQERMHKIMDLTKDHKTYTANFCMAYGGREEITDAMKKIGEKIEKGKLHTKDIDEKLVQDHLYSSSSPDFIIRTSGELRTSNFLIWQGNYSEWFFLKKTWPEFEKEDLAQCIEEFKQRNRRFGK